MHRLGAAAIFLALSDVDCTSLEDGDLANRILAATSGEAGAEEAELCERFARRVRLYGLRHLGDEDAAADLVQRVLVLTLEKLRTGGVREPARIASFVLGVARMLCLEISRQTGRRRPLSDSPEVVVQAAAREPEAPAPESLGRCLEGLTERERSVVLLSFYQQQSASEIAEALSSTAGNVRVIRHRAIVRLRDCMGAWEEGRA